MWSNVDQQMRINSFVSGLQVGKVHHAYLVLGPKNSGKEFFALKMAQAVNCTGTNPPCGTCPACSRIWFGTHPDVEMIDSHSFNESTANAKILKDVAREIRNKANLRPYEAQYRVFLIGEAKKMTIHTANALLKLLEEPEPNVIYILVASSEQDVLPTVASRCQKIRLNKMTVTDTVEFLIQETGVEVLDATEMAKLAQAGTEWEGQKENDRKDLLQIRARLANISSVTESSLKSQLRYADHLVAKWVENDEAVRDEMQLWLNWWRDLLMVKIGMPSLVTCSSQLDQLDRNADKYDVSAIKDTIVVIQETADCLDHNVNPKLAIPYMVLHACFKNVIPVANRSVMKY